MSRQHIRPMLRIESDFDVPSQNPLSALQGFGSRQQIQQGRLSGSVGSHQTNPPSSFHFKLKSAIHWNFAVGMRDARQANHAQAASLRLGEGKLNRALFLGRSRRLFHPLNLFEFALRLSRFCVFGSKSVHKSHQAVDFFLLIFIGGFRLLFVRAFLRNKVVVIASIATKLSSSDVHNRVRYLVQKLAVVGNEQNGALIFLQVTLQPQQRGQIEVIGWLVQHQKIRFLHQEPSQVGAHYPTAAERPGRLCPIRIRKPQPAQHFCRLGLQRVAVQFLKPLMSVFYRHSQFVCVPCFVDDNPAQCRMFLRNGGCPFQCRLLSLHLHFLREIAEDGASPASNLAGVRIHLAHRHFQQSAFARAVWSHQSNPISWVHL